MCSQYLGTVLTTNGYIQERSQDFISLGGRVKLKRKDNKNKYIYHICIYIYIYMDVHIHCTCCSGRSTSIAQRFRNRHLNPCFVDRPSVRMQKIDTRGTNILSNSAALVRFRFLCTRVTNDFPKQIDRQ